MSKNILRTLVCITFIAAVFVYAVNTNWFRYQPGLVEGVVILMYLAGFLLIVLFSLVVLLLQKNHPILLIIAVLLNLFYPVWAVLGNWTTISFSAKTGFNYVDKLPAAVCSSEEGEVKYWVELKNPWSARHEEFLVLEKNSEKQVRIMIDVFGGQPTSFILVNDTSWGNLSPTAEKQVYMLEIGENFLIDKKKKFRIDTLGMTSSVIDASGLPQNQ